MVLRIENLKKIYTETVININQLSISKGEIVGFVGNNGSGKTTLFRLLLDLIKPEEGVVYSKGILTKSSDDWKQYTNAFIDDSFLVDFLTPDEYFQFIANAYRVSDRELETVLYTLKDFTSGEIFGGRKLIRDYSLGNRQKIGIIGALITSPEILILDEPFNFLDPPSLFFIQEYIKKLSNVTTLISGHNIDGITNVANRIIILEKGEIIKDISKMDVPDIKAEVSNYFSN
ncbi:MAG: ABC transporter ATP-binding protein [Siphonobacter sp.]